MSHRLIKMVDECVFWMSDEEVRSSFPESVRIYYGYNNYRNDLAHISDLKKAVWRDYETVQVSDMHVMTLSQSETTRHASMTVIGIEIPVDDYLALLHKKEIEIK